MAAKRPLPTAFPGHGGTRPDPPPPGKKVNTAPQPTTPEQFLARTRGLMNEDGTLNWPVVQVYPTWTHVSTHYHSCLLIGYDELDIGFTLESLGRAWSEFVLATYPGHPQNPS